MMFRKNSFLNSENFLFVQPVAVWHSVDKKFPKSFYIPHKRRSTSSIKLCLTTILSTLNWGQTHISLSTVTYDCVITIFHRLVRPVLYSFVSLCPYYNTTSESLSNLKIFLLVFYVYAYVSLPLWASPQHFLNIWNSRRSNQKMLQIFSYMLFNGIFTMFFHFVYQGFRGKPCGKSFNIWINIRLLIARPPITLQPIKGELMETRWGIRIALGFGNVHIKLTHFGPSLSVRISRGRNFF